ncbi:MAG: LysE family translocator [Chitinophagales bacterium]
MGAHNFLIFVVASLMLNLTPGNDMLYVVSRSAGQGIKAGVISALGIMAGCMVHILAAVVGISAIIAKSATAFDVIKYVGAAYLVYLGIRSIFSRARKSFEYDRMLNAVSYQNIFWQGLLTNVLNPKVALFFLAFLPQFINIKVAHPQWQILFLGVWFDCSGTLVNIIVAIIFGKMGNWLSQSPRFIKIQEKITGILLISLGIKVALTTKK